MRTYAYIRVSKERDDMISPEIQRDEISAYCGKKGWEITEWFQDLDLSGRAWDRRKRKGLDDLMARALAGECDAVVFYRIDRLSREEEDFHAVLAALQRAGVVCDSPGNSNDGSPEASLIWSISAALAKYESVRLVARLKDAHRKLARMGRWEVGRSRGVGIEWWTITACAWSSMNSCGSSVCGCTRPTSRGGRHVASPGRSTSAGSRRRAASFGTKGRSLAPCRRPAGRGPGRGR